MLSRATNLQSISLTMLDCDDGRSTIGWPRAWTAAEHALLHRFFALFANHMRAPQLDQLRLSSNRRGWYQANLPLGLEPVCIRLVKGMLDAGIPISPHLYLAVDMLKKDEILAVSGLLSAYCTHLEFLCPKGSDWTTGAAVSEPFIPVLDLARCKRITIHQAKLSESGPCGVHAYNLMLDRVPTLEMLEVKECRPAPEQDRAIPISQSEIALHHLRFIKWEGNLFLRWIRTRKELAGLEQLSLACALAKLDTLALASALTSCSAPKLKFVVLNDETPGTVLPWPAWDGRRKRLADLTTELDQRGVQVRRELQRPYEWGHR